MRNPEIDFKAVFGDGAGFTEDPDWPYPDCAPIPCPGSQPCPPVQEFRIEPEPDWQELVNQSWRNHPVLRNVPEGLYPETVRRQQVQGIVQIAQEFRKVRRLEPGTEVAIMPPEDILREMIPIIGDLWAHGIRVAGA